MSQEPISKSIKPVDRGLGSVFVGASYPLRALWFFTQNPNYRVYILMPILINLVLGVTLYAGLLFAGFRAIDALFADLPQWTAAVPTWLAHLPHPNFQLPTWNIQLPQWQIPLPQWHISLPAGWTFQLPNWQIQLPNWVSYIPGWLAIFFIGLLRLLLTIILLLVTGFIFLQFGVLLGAPWYGKLSEELERKQTGQLTIIEVGITGDIGRAILYELKKLGIAIATGLPLLLLGLLPGAGTLVTTIGGIAVTATIVCLDFFDSPLERRRLRFRQKLGVIWRSLPASATFGLVCLALISVPLINLVAIPVCVAAGTLFVCDRVLPWLPPPKQEDV
jgi:CysZ protein